MGTMHKKRILVTMPSMHLGGGERSLVGLLESIDYSEYFVDLLLFQHSGELLKDIPPQVNILPFNKRYDVFAVPIVTLLKQGRFFIALRRLLAKIDVRVYCKKAGKSLNTWVSQQYTHKWLEPVLPRVESTYDLAISFMGVPTVVTEKVEAENKACWVHTDYREIVANPQLDKKQYDQVDYVVNVSKSCNDIFLEYYPEMSKKAVVIENILPEALIRRQAKEENLLPEFKRGKETTTLLTVGRFVPQKNFDNVPDICRRLVKLGLNVRWYLIGYGPDENLIQENIVAAGMQDNVVILGKVNNPYPYIAACDIYIQPSRFEGKSVSVREAQMLARPVVVTDYATAPDQLVDDVDGIIVPMNNEGCAQGIVKLAKDTLQQKQYSENCRNRDYSLESEIMVLLEVLLSND